MIRESLSQIPEQPGIYQMFDKHQTVLYVGKASNLKKRLTSYFQKNVSFKTKKLMSQVNDIKTVITQNAYEALLLEAKLIKQHHPRYNILLRDDKSYPYLYVSSEDQFPRISFYRGKKNMKGLFFGPYPNVAVVRSIVDLVQKVFKIRTCTNTFFSSRKRPCLQYQLKRCTAPCVGYVDMPRYQTQVNQVKLFLEGHIDDILDTFDNQMKQASKKLDYERATYFRDRIRLLKEFKMQQVVTSAHDFIDIIGFSSTATLATLSVFSIREGELTGNRNFIIELPMPTSKETVLQTLLIQYYEHMSHSINVWPKQILLPFPITAKALIEQALSKMRQKKIKLVVRCLMRYKVWRGVVQKNAEQALQNAVNKKNIFYKKFNALKKACALKKLNSIYCFDVSHTQGEATIASCVVFDKTGPLKQQYRQFIIQNVKAGDDYLAMGQAIERQMKRVIQENRKLPELIIVDGGKGQLNVAQKVLKTLKLNILLLGIAKGPLRRAGLEHLWLSNQHCLALPATSIAFHLIQHIRDEAHRFAIQAHRKKFKKSAIQSVLECIPGIGKKRRQLLLNHFGGLQQLKKATVDEIIQVNGISKSLAQLIKTYFSIDSM